MNKIYKTILLIIIIFFCFFLNQSQTVYTSISKDLDEDEISTLVFNIFTVRNQAMCKGDANIIKELYNTNLRNGLWAYLHEEKRVKYIQNWSAKQGVEFKDIKSDIKINWFKKNDQVATVNLLASTEYKYVYLDRPEEENIMRIGTYHDIRFENNDEYWIITREWYNDPFADSLDLENLNIEEHKDVILSNEKRDFSDLNQKRIGVVAYADKYCGAAGSRENDFSYNKKYKNYNSLGGDCANFVSQALYEGGKFQKNSSWTYGKDGSRAWLKAQGLKDYMLNSGRASLLAYGTYDQVLEVSYKLLPGDLVFYVKKGKVAHSAIVTGADSRGYSLVNCHNTDRYRVPWDLGWSNKGIKFYLLRVHY